MSSPYAAQSRSGQDNGISARNLFEPSLVTFDQHVKSPRLATMALNVHFRVATSWAERLTFRIQDKPGDQR